MKYKEILDKLTLEEKAGLCSGKNFWHTKGVERLGIPSIMLTDGPHGLRKKNDDVIGPSLNNSYPTTCFPTAATTACSWNPELLYKMGEAMAEECLEEKVSVILGPGVNMKRSPLCGRNFEYFSEDPLLAGELAAGLINGIQSKGIGTSLKHFAGNNQEMRRMSVDSVIDERALREIYLSAFEIAVKKSQPWTVMNAYNKLNGEYCSDSEYLQQTILRDEWGFEGIVVTDWGAANDRVQGIIAGNDLEMPTSGEYNTRKIVDAVRSGRLPLEMLDKRVDKLLDLAFKGQENLCEYKYDKEAHHELAAEIAQESMVLLKNDGNILPLKKGQRVAVIGELARVPRYQGAGSSEINPTMLSDFFTEFVNAGYQPCYAPGYDRKRDVISQTLINAACEKAKQSDVVILFLGLTEEYECEGYDRDHINLPKSHNRLAEEICKVNDNVIVVLSGGSPVTMPWLSSVKALLNGYLGGQASGKAICSLITGKSNPSGKLAETYPLSLEDTQCFKTFPGTVMTSEYRESVYIGYRYYDTAEKDVLFPFGFGLSYTSFEYSGIRVSKKKINDTDSVSVSFKIKNTGDVAGAEIAELYVHDCESTIFRPTKELRGFAKVFLEPGEEKAVKITLDKRAFAYYNVNINDWHVESGSFDILIGASSRDIKLKTSVTVESTVDAAVPDYREAAPEYYTADVQTVSDLSFKAVLGRELPPATRGSEPFTMLDSLERTVNSKWGGRINAVLDKVLETFFSGDNSTAAMVKAMAVQIPMRNFISMSNGIFTEEMCNGLLMILNNQAPAKGLFKIITGIVLTIKNLPELLKMV